MFQSLQHFAFKVAGLSEQCERSQDTLYPASNNSLEKIRAR